MEQCTLVIKDQVNVKFEGLNPIVRRKISEALKFFVPYARHTPSFKLGRWDGKVSFATVGGGTYLNLLDRVLPIVIDAGYDITIDDHRPVYDFHLPEITEDLLADRIWPMDHGMAPGEPIMLKDHQVRAINTYLGNLQSVQSISTSAGKAQPLHAKILTPAGWTTMGEIKVGDVLLTPSGEKTNVVGIFPQGAKPIYRITFADGRTAEACGEHLWRAHKATWHKAKAHDYSDWDTVSTDKLIALLSKKTNRNRISIPLIIPAAEPDIDLPVDPYVMGILLGDGSMRNNRIAISTADAEIIDHVSKRLLDGYSLKHHDSYDYLISAPKHLRAQQGNNKNGAWHHYIVELTKLGLMEKYSYEKSIPGIYMQASPEQKLELIRGLMDSDGTVGRHGETNFSTTSKHLADDLQQLIHSIGGIASISPKQTSYTYNEEKKQGRPSFVVRIRYQKPSDLFHLTRKKDRTSSQHRFDLRLSITGIEEIGTMPAQCIMVDHPDHLYITDNYVVTHNTIITGALSMLVEKYGRTICIVPSKSLVEQTEEDYRNIGLDVGVFYGDRKEYGHQHTICTWQSLSVFAKKIKNKKGKVTEVDFNVSLDTADSDSGITLAQFLDGVICVMVDEVHSAKAKELSSFLMGPAGHIPIRWGLTGTVPKEDFEFLSILSALGPVVGEVRAEELQKLGILSNCHIHINQMNDDHVEFTSYPAAYEYLTTDKRRLEWIAEYCRNLDGNVLILVDRIECGETLSDILDADFISGRVKTKDRKARYREVTDDSSLPFVATYGVAAVGINIPALHHVVLVEPGKAFVRVIQSIGRGLRRTKVKEWVDIHDICSTNKFSKRHLTIRKGNYKEAGYPFTVKKINYR